MAKKDKKQKSAEVVEETQASFFKRRIEELKTAFSELPGWVKANKLKAVLIGGGTVLLTVSLLGGLLMWSLAVQRKKQLVTMEETLEKLDAQDFLSARDYANRLKEQGTLSSDKLGGPVFVLGAVTASEAELAWEKKDQKRYFLLASRYLEEARDRGFPEGRKAEGLFLLGKSLHQSAQYAQAVPILLDSLQYKENDKTLIHRWLFDAYFLDAKPNYGRAKHYVQQYLNDKSLTKAQRNEGLLLKSQVLFELGQYDDTRQVLENIPSDAKIRSEAMIVRGRLTMHDGDLLFVNPDLIRAGTNTAEARNKYGEAEKILRQAQVRDTLGNHATRKSSYLIGVIKRRFSDNQAAYEQFAKTHKRFEDSPEGIAAGLEEAELLRELRHDEKALFAFRRVFKEAGTPEKYSNHWIPLEKFQDRMILAYLNFLNEKDFELAVQLTESFTPMLPKNRATQLRAEAFRAWGSELMKNAEELVESKAGPVFSKARAQYRQAGRTYARLARYRVTSREYPEELWNSAESYLIGQDYFQAVKVLREYLKNESRSRRPRALVGMGEALLALDKPEDALKSFLKCIEFFPKDPIIYQARLMASQAHAEKGENEQAKKLLLDNLQSGNLTPDSKDWIDSLFALGEIYHTEGSHFEVKSREFIIKNNEFEEKNNLKLAIKEMEKSYASYHQAITRLTEAVQRRPQAKQATRSRYLIAEAYRQKSKLPQMRLKTITIENTRSATKKEAAGDLNEAYNIYRDLQVTLNARSDVQELSKVEAAMLRNCYFGQGWTLYQLGRYEDAIRIYSTATSQYPDDPAVLEAYVQIANCHRRMNRPADAKKNVELAKIVLERLTSDPTVFIETTNFGKEEWKNYLDWLRTL